MKVLKWIGRIVGVLGCAWFGLLNVLASIEFNFWEKPEINDEAFLFLAMEYTASIVIYIIGAMYLMAAPVGIFLIIKSGLNKHEI